MKRRLLIIALVFSLLVGVTGSFIKPGTAYASTGNNTLLLVGEHCHDLVDLEHNFSDIQTNPQGNSNSVNECHGKNGDVGWDALLHDSLDCSDQMYYTHDFHTDPQDSSVVTSKWYTHEDAYKYCYNQALAQFSLLAGQTCATVKKDSDNWKQCQDAQNKLYVALGCESKMFQDLNDGQGHWSTKPAAMNNCFNQLAAVGDVHIVVIGADGKFAPDPNPISSSAIVAAAPGGNNPSTAPNVNCDSSGFSLSWIMCPVINGLQQFVGGLNTEIYKLMAIGTSNSVDTDQPAAIFCPAAQTGTPATQTGTCESYHKAWSNFRDLALGLMVIAGLVMVMAQALGMEILDAYTIRKVLPRLLIAALAITLSWQLMEFFVTLSNDLGYGIGALISNPFSGLTGQFNLGATNTLWTILGVGAALTVMGIFSLLSFIGTAAIAVIVAFLTLIVRQLVVVILVMISPIAIVAYILPNTQRFYKTWRDIFMKTLLMFPLIAGFLAVGRVLAAVALQTGGFTQQLIAIIAYFGPYFAIPMTFRFAGGIMSGVGNAINSRGEGMRNALRGFRANRAKQNWQDLKTGNRIKASNVAARAFNRTTRGIATVPSAGFTPWKWRSRFQGGMSTAKQGLVGEYMEKSAAFKAISVNDDYLQATMRSAGGGDTEDDWRSYLSDHGYKDRQLEQGVAKIRAAKRDTNDQVFKQAAVIANSSTGTGWKETGAGGMYAAINEAYGDDRDGAIGALAQMRERSTQARRGDLGGASFNKSLGWMQQMHEGAMSADDATRSTSRRAWEVNGAGWLVGQRGDTVRHVLPAIQDELQSAYASGNQVKIDRTLAKMADLQDVMNYASPEIKEMIGDGIFAQPLGVAEVQRYDADEYAVDGSGSRLPARNSDNSIMHDPQGNVVYQVTHRKGEAKLGVDGRTMPILGSDGKPVISQWNIRNEVEKRQSNPDAYRDFLDIRRELARGRSEDDLRSVGGGAGAPPVGPPLGG